MSESINGQRNFRGKLLGISQNAVSLEVDGGGRIEIPYDKIARANIEYEF
jgi:ribosome maturation factor RimP